VRLAEDLEAVADAEHGPALGGVALHRLHDRAESRDRAGAEIVPVAEAARQEHDVRAVQAGVAMPDEKGVRAGPLGRAQGVEVTVAAGEPDHRHLQHQASSTSRR
jgi:hypothetical protein